MGRRSHLRPVEAEWNALRLRLLTALQHALTASLRIVPVDPADIRAAATLLMESERHLSDAPAG